MLLEHLSISKSTGPEKVINCACIFFLAPKSVLVVVVSFKTLLNRPKSHNREIIFKNLSG